MMPSFYCILLSLCFYNIFVLADEIVCRFDKNIKVQLSNDKALLLQKPTTKFEYDNSIDGYTNRTTSSVRNAFFMALTERQPNQPFTKTIVKFSNIKELSAASDMESHGLIDERQYCSVTLVQEPISMRLGVPRKVESEMRKALLPSLQHKFCESGNATDDENGVVKKMKYRTNSEIAEEKLQATVNAISDFILSRLVYSITNKYAKIPRFSGTFAYPLGGMVDYNVFDGFFYNPANIDRLMNTGIIENNKNRVEVDVAYRLRDINTNFLFKLSDRTYVGQIDVNISQIVFSAKITFDYTACQTKLDVFHILNVGELEYEISKGLAWYEKIVQSQVNKMVYELVTDNLHKVIKKMVTLKVETFQCGAQKKEAVESIKKFAITLGNIIGSVVKKYVNNL